MTETEKPNRKDEDWAIIPFNEDEDEKRWRDLVRETNKLEKNIANYEAVLGTILTEVEISRFQNKSLQSNPPVEENVENQSF